MEQQFLFDAPGVMKDNFFLSCLLASQEKTIPPAVLWKRIEIVCYIFDFPSWGISLYRTLKGTTRFRIRLIQRPIRKAKKFSGWIRSSSSVGSKRPGKTKPEPETFEWVLGDEIDFFHILTVGEFSVSQEIKFLSLKSPLGRNGK